MKHARQGGVVTASFDKWTNRIAAAADEHSRRAVLAEIGAWRAAKLTDVPASRQATFAMSRLYALLGDHAGAVREAHSLLSLCQTPPEATHEETQSARAYLASLGEKLPKEIRAPRERSQRSKPDANSRRDRSENGRRDKPAPYAAAAAAAREGRWSDGLRAMRGKGGPRADLLRTWLHLSRALGKEDVEERFSDLRDLEQRLRKTLEIDGRKPTERKVEANRRVEEPSTMDDPLSPIIGMRAPRRRDALVRALEKHASQHPDQLDQLAAGALRHHLSTQGPKRAAPWLIGTVAHALAMTDGVATATAIDALRTAGAFAVSAYGEVPFSSLLPILREALEGGWGYRGMRRGVSRDEPANRRMWTLRLSRDRSERLIVRAPETEEPYPEGMVGQLVPRILELCPRVVLYAPGSGNDGLREAAIQAGIAVVDADSAALSALASVETAEALPSTDSPATPRPPKPHDALEALLLREEPATVDEIVTVLGGFRRRYRAFQVAEKIFSQLSTDCIATLLEAVHIDSDTDRRIPSGTTLAVRAAGRSSESRVHSILLTSPTAARYGGLGIEDVVGINAALQAQGWELHRLLNGPTKRERDDSPAVDSLAEHLGGLWRLLVGKDGVRGEVWFVAGLPPEGRAAVPQLLLRDAHRAVVMPIDADLLAWYGTLGGPPAIGWTGEEGTEVVEAVTGWPSPAPEAP